VTCTLSSDDLATIRFHFSRGVSRRMVAGWYGLRPRDLEALLAPPVALPPKLSPCLTPVARHAPELGEVRRAAVQAVAADTPRRRACLKCGRPFQSGWAGHRVCTPCKNTDAWRSGDGVA